MHEDWTFNKARPTVRRTRTMLKQIFSSHTNSANFIFLTLSLLAETFRTQYQYLRLESMFVLKGTFIVVLATVSIFFRKADANNIGIAFSGGGFKSVADQVRFFMTPLL